MYIDGNPLLHVIEEGIKFQAGRWLQNLSAKHTQDMLQNCWIDTYLGPLDIIVHDAKRNFVCIEFRQYAINIGSTIKGVPVESHNLIGLVERYHGPLRRIYNIIISETPGIDKHLALQMTFKALNDSVGPDGLVPTLLVFSAYPRMVESDAPSPTVTERTKALRTATQELERIRATRQVYDALNTRNDLFTTEIHKLPLNFPVLVRRERNSGHLGKWDGPFKLLNVDGETCTINMPSGPTQFPITNVKTYLTEQDNPQSTNTNSEVPTVSEMSPSKELTTASETSLNPPLFLESQPQSIIEPFMVSETSPQFVPHQVVQSEAATQSRRPKRNAGKPSRYLTGVNNADITVFLNEEDQFKEPCRKEINGLLEKGVFEVVQDCIVPAGTRIFNLRFVEEVKF
ncbi:hypothetical protein K3495_g1179 [Podosphaera aphanis]|nr:hypothetical protein K3495_g1179 [Podosphaera aphanis]